jgi:UDP-2,3-diacylglucosamine pyrophosphatase LpxH
MARISFGVVSDTHFGSTAQEMDAVHRFYQWVRNYTNRIYHAGDLTDGLWVYRGQERNQLVYGVDELKDYTVRRYPRHKGLKTMVVSGNHDLRIWDKTGHDIVREICAERRDMEYLGRFRGEVSYPFGKVWIVHPAGGSFYSISYGGQKYVRGLDEKRKPKLIIFGHRHRKAFYRDLGIDILEAGCFQGQNDFTIRRGLTPTVGGWLVEIEYEGRTISAIRPTWRGKS